MPRYSIQVTIEMLIPAAIAPKACVGYWKVSSSHVFSRQLSAWAAHLADLHHHL
jgi:hypothetical protein